MEICNTGSNADITVLDQKAIRKKYPDARIIVLDDDFNTFEHVFKFFIFNFSLGI